MLREDCRGQAGQDLADRGRRPATVLVQPVEHGERRQRPDHVFGLFDRAPGTKGVGCGERLGQRPVRLGIVDLGMGQVAVQGRVAGPGRARALDVAPKSLAGIRLRKFAALVRRGQSLEQARPGAEAVVDRDPRDAGPAGDRSDAGLRGGALGDQLACRGEDRAGGQVDRRLAPAEPVNAAAHPTNLTYCLSNEYVKAAKAGQVERRVDNLPSHAVRLWDPLAIREFSALLRDPVFRGRGVPPGDGRPVLLVPGFLAGDWTPRIMGGGLRRIGYRTYLSGILLNIQHSERLLSGLRRKVAEIEKENHARVSMVGHSRGGLLAKVLSQRKPQLVEQVITLGAPVADWTDLAALTHHAVGVVRTANELAYGRKLNSEGRFTYDLKLTPVVPTTSIYTQSDDVVNFRSCLRPDIPAIPVWGSHNGLVVNPEVFRVVGRLLARPRRSA